MLQSTIFLSLLLMNASLLNCYVRAPYVTNINKELSLARKLYSSAEKLFEKAFGRFMNDEKAVLPKTCVWKICSEPLKESFSKQTDKEKLKEVQKKIEKQKAYLLKKFGRIQYVV